MGAFDTVCPLVCKWGQLPPLPRLRRLCRNHHHQSSNQLLLATVARLTLQIISHKKSSTTSLVIPLTDRETEKLNTQRQKHNLLGGGKNSNWQNVVWQRRLTMLQLPTCIRLNTRVYATTGCDSSCLRPTILMSVSRSIVVLLWY